MEGEGEGEMGKNKWEKSRLEMGKSMLEMGKSMLEMGKSMLEMGKSKLEKERNRLEKERNKLEMERNRLETERNTLVKSRLGMVNCSRVLELELENKTAATLRKPPGSSLFPSTRDGSRPPWPQEPQPAVMRRLPSSLLDLPSLIHTHSLDQRGRARRSFAAARVAVTAPMLAPPHQVVVLLLPIH
ncbi:unnamed protein product [Sphagnum troendelagicum]|uniref:Uncharacterized protein n=1 Tax=Sphagnum troendelagicum TaxID=128251 RepID=A0ABP0UXY6_9BRYO